MTISTKGIHDYVSLYIYYFFFSSHNNFAVFLLYRRGDMRWRPFKKPPSTTSYANLGSCAKSNLYLSKGDFFNRFLKFWHGITNLYSLGSWIVLGKKCARTGIRERERERNPWMKNGRVRQLWWQEVSMG